MTTKKFQEIDKDIQDLILAAIKARVCAYAPYSHFKVGSALRTLDGEIFTGCNVENSVYLANHAEEVALTNMIATRNTNALPHIKEIAIALRTKEDMHAFPCGYCRQKIGEFASAETIIIGVCIDENETIQKIEFATLDELLPYNFGSENLKI